jgi:hypothetical protein
LIRPVLPIAAVLLLSLGAGPVGAAGSGSERGPVPETAAAGAYQVTLKVLPAESFSGTGAEMVRDAGAEPVDLGGASGPDHHLVAFVKRDGKPIESATVAIRYSRLAPKESDWVTLPVVRMHVAGKSLATTHYGNNARLAPGRYVAEVVVDGGPPAVFRFSVGPSS